MADVQRFRSKIDVWLPVVIFAPLLWSIYEMLTATGESGIKEAQSILLGLGILALPLGFVLWIMVSTWYGVSDRELTVRSGPLRMTIPLSQIRTVRRTRSLWSAPALSLRRLEVQYAASTDSQRSVVISPADIEGFLQALIAGNPRIQRLEGL